MLNYAYPKISLGINGFSAIPPPKYFQSLVSQKCLWLDLVSSDTNVPVDYYVNGKIKYITL